MSKLFDDIRNHLPPYLSATQKKGLFDEIDKFPYINYYTNGSYNKLLQGDGWSDFTILDFATGNRKQTKGIILSNSCDIDTDNTRDTEINIIYAPLVKLDNFVSQLQMNKVDDKAIEAKVQAIRQQHVTSMMYLPKVGRDDAEYIVNFDDIRSQPLNFFLQQEKTKLFTLSLSGFYAFLLKISIHFCRFQEGITR